MPFWGHKNKIKAGYRLIKMVREATKACALECVGLCEGPGMERLV